MRRLFLLTAFIFGIMFLSCSNEPTVVEDNQTIVVKNYEDFNLSYEEALEHATYLYKNEKFGTAIPSDMRCDVGSTSCTHDGVTAWQSCWGSGCLGSITYYDDYGIFQVEYVSCSTAQKWCDFGGIE